MPPNYLSPLIAICVLCCCPHMALAAPSAGDLLRQIERDISPRSNPPSASIATASKVEGDVASGPSVAVEEFDFRGNRLVEDAILKELLIDFTQTPQTFAQLHNAAAVVSQYYRQEGWAARVYIPKQEIVAGRVILRIVEAAFGSAHFNGEFNRVSQARLARMLVPIHEHGDPLRIVNLERSVLLMDDLPGVGARAALHTGEHRGETDLIVELNEARLVGGGIVFDTAGARATGEERVVGRLVLNSPFLLGEQFSVTAMATSDTRYGRLEYTMPIAYSGLRWGVSGSMLDYDLQEEFSSLDASGKANTVGTKLSYPLIRSQQTNLFASIAYQRAKYSNSSFGSTLSNYVNFSVSASVQFSRRDDWRGGGVTTAGARFYSGQLDLTNSPNRLADAATVRANGSYNKIVLQAGRLQWLSASTQVTVSISGQLASKNLDSSEHFSLGGSRGVRAYPANEASGDEGWLFTAQWRKYLGYDLSVDVFYDHGWARLNRNASFAGAQDENTFSLEGAGMALNWQPPSGIDMSAVWSHRVGNNPLRLPNGNDSDGSLEKNRFWFSTSFSF